MSDANFKNSGRYGETPRRDVQTADATDATVSRARYVPGASTAQSFDLRTLGPGDLNRYCRPIQLQICGAGWTGPRSNHRPVRGRAIRQYYRKKGVSGRWMMSRRRGLGRGRACQLSGLTLGRRLIRPEEELLGAGATYRALEGASGP